MILDKASIDAIYNALQSETNLSIKFSNGFLIPESIRKVASNSPDAFLHDLYIIATSPQMVEIATTSTNDYYIGDQFFSDSWRSPSDIDYAEEFNNGQESLLGLQGSRRVLSGHKTKLQPDGGKSGCIVDLESCQMENIRRGGMGKPCAYGHRGIRVLSQQHIRPI